MGLFKKLSMGNRGRYGSAPVSVSMTVDALQEKVLVERLNGLGNRVFRKVVAGAANSSMTPVLKTARRFVPVDEGALRDSLTKKRKVYKKTQTVWVGVGAAKGMAPHAHLVEFGHRMVGGAVWYDPKEDKYFRVPGMKGRTLGFVRPKAFLRPAFIKEQANVLNRYRKTLAKGIDREALKNA